MDMKKWVADTIAADKKKALPVLSFPAIQPMGITVRELIGSSEKQAEAMRLIAEKCDTAASVSFMDLSVEAEAFGSKTVVTDDEVPTVVGAIIDEDSDPDDLQVPAVGAGRTGLYLEAIEKVADQITDRPILAGCIGPFSLAGRLMDVSEIMILCYEEPELVHAVLKKANTFLEGYIKAFKDRGADGIVMAEPLAGLLSPDLASEFSGDYVKELVSNTQSDDFGIFYHNCGGGVPKTLDSIIGNGAMGYHFGNAIDMLDVMDSMPKDVIVMGNVDPAGQLRNGTPESVRAKTTEILQNCSKYPNFVISTGCDVPPMSPWENIDAFMQAVADYYA